MMSPRGQTSMWPDATFGGNRARQFKRTSQEARRDFYQAYLCTPQWQCRRQEALTAARFHCEGCGSQAALQVHHFSYEHLGNEWPEDIGVLCRTCHQAWHDR